MASLLSISDLRVSFPQSKGKVIEVVHGIDIEVAPKEVVAIVGESGSGKSVSMMAISGLVPKAKVEASTCLLNVGDQSFDLLNCSEKDLQSLRATAISYVFQEPMTALNPLMKCGDQVAEAMTHKEASKKKVCKLFEEVQLPDVERVYSSYPHQLSGGQRQRVMIAMALANDPALLIADEPTTALDAIVQNGIVELLADTCRSRGMGLVFISHDLNVVKRIADKVLVMLHGKLVDTGTAQEIFENSSNEYTQGLLDSKPSFEKKGRTLSVYDSETGISHKSKAIEEINREIKPLLSFKDTAKSYFKSKGFLRKKLVETKAVKQVDFEIMQGEIVGLVGESGCGKSTLAKLTAKLVKATKGEILWDGEDIYSMQKKYSRHVQMVFQDPYSSLNPSHKVGKAILEPMLVHGIAKSKKSGREMVKKLLQDVGLEEADYDKYPHEFSGGQRQRVCIARALAMKPELIICDEAVSALDVSVQAKILNLLIELQRKYGLTYLFISHDLNVVSYICDRIVVMREGEIVELKTTEELLSNPDSEYSKSLMDFR